MRLAHAAGFTAVALALTGCGLHQKTKVVHDPDNSQWRITHVEFQGVNNAPPILLYVEAKYLPSGRDYILVPVQGNQ